MDYKDFIGKRVIDVNSREDGYFNIIGITQIKNYGEDIEKFGEFWYLYSYVSDTDIYYTVHSARCSGKYFNFLEIDGDSNYIVIDPTTYKIDNIPSQHTTSIEIKSKDKLKCLMKDLRKHYDIILNERNEIRKIKDDICDILEPLNEGIDIIESAMSDIESAIDTISTVI